MKGLRLYKKEKLCSEVAIEKLFSHSVDTSSALSYPLRAVWRVDADRRSDAPLAFVVSVPKKRLRHAVDRVAMRRKIREAYRLARHKFPLAEGLKVDVVFIFVSNHLKDYASIAAAMDVLLAKIQTQHGAPAVLSNSSDSNGA